MYIYYLKDLRQRFATAEQYASEHADIKQTQYAHRYNLRSRKKQFDINEQVLVLTHMYFSLHLRMQSRNFMMQLFN